MSSFYSTTYDRYIKFQYSNIFLLFIFLELYISYLYNAQ